MLREPNEFKAAEILVSSRESLNVRDREDRGERSSDKAPINRRETPLTPPRRKSSSWGTSEYRPRGNPRSR
jgi:hypothetical protein